MLVGKGRPFGLLTDPESFWGGGRRDEGGGEKAFWQPVSKSHDPSMATFGDVKG